MNQNRINTLRNEITSLEEEAERSKQEEENLTNKMTVSQTLAQTNNFYIRRLNLQDAQQLQAQLQQVRTRRANILANISAKRRQLMEAEVGKTIEGFRQSVDTAQGILQAQMQQAHKKASHTPIQSEDYDFFISHASEDKDEVARPLAEALKSRGARVWYDEFTLRIGNSLRRSIEQGLSHSRFGIVILSHDFFNKSWPQSELDGLVVREHEELTRILPIWHKITKEEITSYSPSLADKIAAITSQKSISAIACQILTDWPLPHRNR